VSWLAFSAVTTAARALWEAEYGPVPEGKKLFARWRALVRLPPHHIAVGPGEMAYWTGWTGLDRKLRIRAWALRLQVTASAG
jgi:hypothetical protein